MLSKLLSTIIAALTLLALGVQASEHTSKLLRGPYLQMSTSDSIVIVWRLDGLTKPSVRYGEDSQSLNLLEEDNITLRIAPEVDEVPRNKRLYSRLHSAAANTYQYEMTLTGLKPDTTYFYSIYTDDSLLDSDNTLSFRTHPVIGKKTPIRIWAVGDSGTGNQDQASVYNAAMEKITKDGIPLSMYIHVGDMAYKNGEDDEFQQNYFDVYQPTLSNIVCWPAMGNHEGYTSSGKTEDGPYYDAYVCPSQGEAGGFPSGTEAYYSFDYGNIHFVCLDSHDLDRHDDGVMANWLKKDLAATQADWLVAFWHHPPYTKGSHDSDIEPQLIEMREQIMPIMEAHGVDLVLTGHSHVYERSMLVDKAYHTPTTNEGVVLDDGDGHIHQDGAYHKGHGLNAHEGVAQIVTGHGGANVSRRGVIPIMRHTIVEHGSVLIDIIDDTLTARMINKFGEEMDQFSIVKKGKVNPRIVKNPWDPTGPTATPSGGPIPNDYKVALTPVRYWKNGEIYYTLDGSEPTQQSLPYNGKLSIPQDKEIVVLKSRSFNGDKVQSSVTTNTILKKYGQTIPLTERVMQIDGELDDWNDWEGESVVMNSIDNIVAGKSWNGPDDLSATIKYAWNSQGIYFAFSILDDDFNPSMGSSLYNYDAVQIMIDGRELDQQTNSSLSKGAYNILVGQDLSSDKAIVIPSSEDLADCSAVVVTNEKGYNIEVFVPFSRKAFPSQGFKEGRGLQLSFNLSDRDIRDEKSTIKTMNWGATFGRNSYRNTSHWKPVKLGE